MTAALINNKRKIKELANSRNIKKPIIKSINKISKNEIFKLKLIEKTKFNKKELLFFEFITLLLISIIFRINCQYSLIYKDSIITLKFSKTGQQKIFNNGEIPDKIYKDEHEIPQNLSSPIIIDLYPYNIVKLIWKTKEIHQCYRMFLGCDSIIEMNFTGFDATKCTSTFSMFRDCSSLKSLDLSGFITSNSLKHTAEMFRDCKSLISLNLSTFDTSEIFNLGHMFTNCESLKFLDISNFKTDKVQYFDNMFNGCKSLTSLNLSNFNTSKMVKMHNMFKGCESLKIIDFSNLDITNADTGYLYDAFLNCKHLEYLNLKNLNTNDNLDNNFFIGSKKNLIICNDNYKINLINSEEDNNKICRIIYCYDDLSDFEYKLNTEDDCFTKNCTAENYKYEFRKKCYMECPDNSTNRTNKEELEGFIFDKNYFCKPICDEELFPFEIIYTQECVNDCNIDSLTNNSCILNSPKNDTIIFNIILKKIDDLFISEDYNTSEIEKGENEIMKYKHMTVTLTSSKNQKNDENNGNVTTINLGECERLLKGEYNISSDEELFMKIIEVKEEGMLIPKVEFEVYYKLNGTNLIKLNLSHCQNSKIDIFLPTNINKNDIDKYNSSGGYYNDICYTTTSEDGTDIILNDRRTEFIDYNRTVCQENCIFSDFNSTNNKAKCACDVVEPSSNFENIKINKAKLYENFIDIKNFANIMLLICYKVLFTKNGLIKNYGSYSVIMIIIIHFIIIIIYYSKNLFKQIKKKIIEISHNINNFESLKVPNIDNIKKGTLKQNKIRNKKIVKKFELSDARKFKNSMNDKSTEFNKKKDYNNNPPIKKRGKQINKENVIEKTINLKYHFKQTKRLYKTGNNKLTGELNSKKTEGELNKIKNILPYNDEELNNLKYELALKYDNRKYCGYYCSLLKTKHPLIFTFCYNNDYNIKIIKIDLFLFNFVLFFITNALFFNDDTMHKIYKDKGEFDIIGQLPQTVYSFIISSFFSFILENLALTEDDLLDLKKIKSKDSLIKITISLNKKIKIKFLLYFIISSIFLISFWYYLAMFCAIYKNTQIYLIKDTLLSFILSFIEPFGIFLIPGLFRIPSLANKNNKRNVLYRFSQILQNFLI